MRERQNDIIISDLGDFDIRHILECGQIFRYKKLDDKTWQVFSLDKTCVVIQDENCARILSDDKDYFSNYFDLQTDYGKIKSQLSAL
ncbi:MAG: DNA glycosylase, partial [Clostridia bacterium]